MEPETLPTPEVPSEGASQDPGNGVTKPSAPGGFELQFPASALSNQADIRLQFSGLEGREELRVFADSSCSDQLGLSTADSDVFDFELSLLADGACRFYASKVVDGLSSACSKESVSYQLDSQIRELTALSLPDFPAGIGTDPTPIVRVQGAVDLLRFVELAKLYNQDAILLRNGRSECFLIGGSDQFWREKIGIMVRVSKAEAKRLESWTLDYSIGQYWAVK